MAKEGDGETIMSAAKLKPLLMRSKQEPVFCAIGMSKSKDGVILLDKKAKPRKLLGILKTLAKKEKVDLDLGSIRFGHASVDTEVDAAMVTFTVNKEAPGPLRLAILGHLKKAGFGKCEIIVDTAIDSEADDAEDDTEETPAAAGLEAAPEVPSAAPSPAAASAEDTPASPPSSPTVPEMAALTARLIALVKQMQGAMAADPANADTLKAAAVAAQAAIKSNDAETAGSQINTLEALLPRGAGSGPAAGAAPAAQAAGRNSIGSPVFGKARATWVATRKKVEGELGKLHKEMMSVYAGHGAAAELDTMFTSKVEPIMGKLDDSLAHKLDEVASNSDPATHEKLVGEARKIIAGYEDYLASEKLISDLDKNPFVPLSIQATLTASLTALSKVIA